MILYDDKTKGTIKSGMHLLITDINSIEDTVFKASYIVSADLICQGKITALFDLIVFGNICAKELDVKGRLVCMGQCIVKGDIVVQNDIWAEDIQADNITCHDRILAQAIDAKTVIADGNIIIGKTIAVEEKAQTYQNIICGETAYGSGKIVASTILTAEPLDLDDGEDAIESPFFYAPKINSEGNTEVSKNIDKYTQNNDYSGFIASIIDTLDKNSQEKLKKYLFVLKIVENAYPDSIDEFKDVSILIWLIDITQSDAFKDWSTIRKWTDVVCDHFRQIIEGKVQIEPKTKPANELCVGYTVTHKKYGRGIVTSIINSNINGKLSNTAVINFDKFGEKKFPIPESLKFLSILCEEDALFSETLKMQLKCDISSYSEWLCALEVINFNKEYLGIPLYDTIYGLLLAKLGLKAKFVEERFKEKGWN